MTCSPKAAPSSSATSCSLRELIHLLNQRYYQQWLRAEQLERELAQRCPPWWTWLQRGCRRVGQVLLRRRRSRCDPALSVTSVLHEPSHPVPGSVSVIIPFRDHLPLLRNCLRSLHRSSLASVQFILVDNGSREPRTRRVLERLRQRPQFRIVRCAEPFNFSRLCNQGAKLASGDYLLFLNNDTEMICSDSIERMMRLACLEQVGIVGATLLYPDGTIQHAGLFPGEQGRWEHRGRGLPGEHGSLNQIRVVPAVTGACLMIRRDRFIQLGGFEERLPVTYSDVDLCLRAQRAGWWVVLTPHGRFLHFEGLTRGFSTDHPGVGHLQAMPLFPTQR